MMKITNYLAAVALMLSASIANGSTVFAPTNEDSDFVQIDFFGLSTNGGDLALFDEADFGGVALVIGDAGADVTFTASGSDWTAEAFDVGGASLGSITLTGDKNFVLGMSWDSGTTYFADSSVAPQSTADTFLVTFESNDERVAGVTLAVDVAVVPVPAAAWLFGSGLIGLVGVARRQA